MKLPDHVLKPLAEMVIGDNNLFPYRSSAAITSFFKGCGLDYAHDGSTRVFWTRDVLAVLNDLPNDDPDLPSAAILRVIDEMFVPYEFAKCEKNITDALADLNSLIKREGIEVYFDASDHCRIRNTSTGRNSSVLAMLAPPLTPAEIERRRTVADFLDSATEDEFTERVVVPLFRGLGFVRVSATGHKDKSLEFGKDLWMKYQLPTGHWLYFGAQTKKGKIDASGIGGDRNVSNVLTQAKMAIESPVFDPDTNRKVLVDHMFIVSAGEITKAARDWLGTHLDTRQRRQIIFMDRDEFLNHTARILIDLQTGPDIEP